MHDWFTRIKHQPIHGSKTGLKHKRKMPLDKIVKKFSFLLLIIIMICTVGTIFWYNLQLSPVDSGAVQLKKIVVEPGDNSLQIGNKLEKMSVIRNAFVFDLYSRLNSKNSILQAGTYRLSAAESVPQIIEHFVKGSVDKFSITFYPGATLTDNTDTPADKKQDVTTMLENAGYSKEEISSAFNVLNIGLLFDGKPETTGLEGYIYGETYQFNTGVTVEDILRKVFDEFYSVVKSEDLVNKFEKHGLNLYQGITLASIIQRESSNPADQKQIAQVFYSRLNQGIVLGSDVTYQYAAAKLGVKASPTLQSPYNTRIHSGLPPGPISSPGLSALKAVADPAAGSYMYFLSGDDDKTYFAYTEAQHQANIANHCQKKCATP